MKILFFLGAIGFILFGPSASAAPLSPDTEACLSCHATLHPGIVEDWKKSLHSQVPPGLGLRKEKLERRVSAPKIPPSFTNIVVGCAECHILNPDQHKDSFEHGGYSVHVVVTPEDCAICHPDERNQYALNKMAHAHKNLVNNPVYHGLAESINGIQLFQHTKPVLKPSDPETQADSCLFCHGTMIQVKGLKTRETSMGEMKFPVLSGWPNQGVGRINPDGSLGSCTSCHARHEFSIEVARKPYTCSECHKGPDVPAFKVYEVSKHENIFSSRNKSWDFKAVPWKVGKDFNAPTCASCHASLVVNGEGEVIAERTHRMNDRLSWRLMGLIYSHPQPKSPDTTIIKNKAGLPLPTELTGEPAMTFLIDEKEQKQRDQTLQKICRSCHGTEWVANHFVRLKNTIQTTNQMTLTATQIMATAWEKGAAKGLAQKDSIFNEAIEKKWVEQWLFYANSTRFASAMSGADYGVFAEGRWNLSKNIQEMLDWLSFKLKDRQSSTSSKDKPKVKK
jgi:nitrate/TMAO reductase-like tetraheme cytochrome c subunit